MPWAPTPHCTQPGCPTRTTHRYCDHHQAQITRDLDQRRGSPAARGYDHTWTQRRDTFLARHPICARCGNTATIAHHHTRRTLLVAMHDPDPDADHHLTPYCDTCHATHHAQQGDRWGTVTP